VKRREGIGGVTIAVVGLVLALSVGIAATAKGRAFGNNTPSAKAGTGAVQRTMTTTTNGKRTTTIWLKTVVSQPATSSQRRGKCIADTPLVATTPVAQKTLAQRLREIYHRGAGRGGHPNRGIDT
jgi:hypothetical protein